MIYLLDSLNKMRFKRQRRMNKMMIKVEIQTEVKEILYLLNQEAQAKALISTEDLKIKKQQV